jgi:hypothetical protein
MPFVSEAQRRLMYAAAAGKKTKSGVSQAAAKKMVAHDESGKLPEKVEKANGMGVSAPVMPTPQIGAQGSSVDTAMMKAEGDGSDMAKQLLAQIQEMSVKLNQIIESDGELEDWVDSKIVTAKKDLEDIAGYLKHNQEQKFKMSIHGSENTPDRTVSTVDTMAKAQNFDETTVFQRNRLNYEQAHKDFVKKHGSTIMALNRGEKLHPQVAAEYNKDRGNLPAYHGMDINAIPRRAKTSDIHQEPTTLDYSKMNAPKPSAPASTARYDKNGIIDVQPIDTTSAQTAEVKALPPAKKSMEALANPKSLLAKVENCMKCMRKNEEDLEKSSKKKSKPFHGYNKKKHARSGGLNDSYRKKLNRETGSNLKRPVTKKNVKPGSKAANRRKSFCARMSGVKGPTSKKGKLTPKGAALKRWRCSKSLNKSESTPIELRAQNALKSLQNKFDKSNTVKPFGENIYDATANLGRKMGRAGEVVEGAGPNTAVQSTKPTAKEQAAAIADRDAKRSADNPVRFLDLSDVHPSQHQAVVQAFLMGQEHEDLPRAIKVMIPSEQKKKRTKKSMYEEDDNNLEKKFSLKGALTAGLIGASAMAGNAQASPESDLHSQMSKLNVMGEYHTPKTGSQAILKEPGQLKADPSHPMASYSKESTGGSSTGSFHGPDAEKAKALLQNYDSVNKSFKKSDKLKGGKGDEKTTEDFSSEQVAAGKKVETEHTKDPKVAEEISLDHLSEDPRYYSKLKSAGLADELKKAKTAVEKLEKRCWKGYKPVKGKEPYSKGSCEPVSKSEEKPPTHISAKDIESGSYSGEKLDANHHNRIGNEYKAMAQKALKMNDKEAAQDYHAKSKYHFSLADVKGYKPPQE